MLGSRATVYQYFGSRGDIFAELAEALEAELLLLVRRLGPLGASDSGFENLRWWLRELLYVYDDFGPVFLLWPEIAPGVDTLFGGSSAFRREFEAAIAERLRRAGLPAPDNLRAIGLGLLATAERTAHFLRIPSVLEDPLVDALALTTQCVLIPDTPDDVLRRAMTGGI